MTNKKVAAKKITIDLSHDEAYGVVATLVYAIEVGSLECQEEMKPIAKRIVEALAKAGE